MLDQLVSAAALPVVGAVVVGAKLVSLVPLIAHWNSDSSHQKPFIGVPDILCSSKAKSHNESVARIGIHSVAVHDAIAEREVLEGDIKVMETDVRGPTKVMSKSEMMVRGYIIPSGTMIILNVPI